MILWGHSYSSNHRDHFISSQLVVSFLWVTDARGNPIPWLGMTKFLTRDFRVKFWALATQNIQDRTPILNRIIKGEVKVKSRDYLFIATSLWRITKKPSDPSKPVLGELTWNFRCRGMLNHTVPVKACSTHHWLSIVNAHAPGLSCKLSALCDFSS